MPCQQCGSGCAGGFVLGGVVVLVAQPVGGSSSDHTNGISGATRPAGPPNFGSQTRTVPPAAHPPRRLVESSAPWAACRSTADWSARRVGAGPEEGKSTFRPLMVAGTAEERRVAFCAPTSVQFLESIPPRTHGRPLTTAARLLIPVRTETAVPVRPFTPTTAAASSVTSTTSCGTSAG